MKNPAEFRCSLCGVRACTHEPSTKKMPSFCLVAVESEPLAAIERTYLEDEELRKLACESARTESAGYCRNTRIQEIVDFARRIGATRLGIAHCVGLMGEAKVAREIFLRDGFEVAAICRKVGSIEQENLGLKDG